MSRSALAGVCRRGGRVDLIRGCVNTSVIVVLMWRLFFHQCAPVGGIVMPGDDDVSSLRESMKQDYRHIDTLARKTASFILGQLLVRIKMLLTFSSVIPLLTVP